MLATIAHIGELIPRVGVGLYWSAVSSKVVRGFIAVAMFTGAIAIPRLRSNPLND
jgi:hypothetical protein